MNYYERHLGDYAKDTAHLTMLEHGAYGLLLDRCYATEQGIPADQAHRIARARSKEEKAAVDSVLAEFFSLTDGVWTNQRVEQEIAKARKKIEAARTNGKGGGRPKKNPEGTEQKPTGLLLGSDSETQQKAHQTPDTSNTPHTPRGGRATAVSLPTWLDAVKAKGEKPVPENDGVFAYADEVGLPVEFLRLAWLEFRHRYSQPDSKRYRDWRTVFRKAVRGNWLRLWWADPTTNSFALTTTGVQAQRAHQEKAA